MNFDDFLLWVCGIYTGYQIREIVRIIQQERKDRAAWAKKYERLWSSVFGEIEDREDIDWACLTQKSTKQTTNGESKR